MSSEKSVVSNTHRGLGISHEHEIIETGPAWRPGYAEQLPIIGLSALLTMAILSVAAFIVLCVSNNVSSESWPQIIAPHVIVSIFNSLAALALTIAVSDGVAIAWWRHAMRGSTVKELHQQWSFTTHASQLLTHPRAVLTSSIALAVLATQITLLNSILYQRATSTYEGTWISTTKSSIGIGAQEFPMTGYVVSNTTIGAQVGCNCFMIGDSYTPVVTTWETSNGFFSGYNELFRVSDEKTLGDSSTKYNYCDGICYTSLQAIGFEIECNELTNHSDLATPGITAYDNSGPTSAYTNIPIFNSSFALQYANPSQGINHSSIILSLQYFQSDNPYNPSSSSCPGTLKVKTCVLRPALISYPIKITNFTNHYVINGVSLSTQTNTSVNASTLNAIATPPPYSTSNKQAAGYRVLSYLYPADTHDIRALTALGGLASALDLYLSSAATITYTGNGVWSLRQSGTLSQTMMYGPPNMGSCDCSFRDSALDTIIQSINELAFLTATGLVDTSSFRGLSNIGTGLPSALVVATDSNSTAQFRVQDGNATQIADVVHYSTHFVFAGLALGITLSCIGLVLPSFWRYGQLGRRVTLGPMEIASAFGAPVLTATGAEPKVIECKATGELERSKKADGIDGLIREIGDRKIQYGFVEVPHAHHGAAEETFQHWPTSPMVAKHPEPNKQVIITIPDSPMHNDIDRASIDIKTANRKSVRLAISTPEVVRHVSTIYPNVKSPRIGTSK